MSSKPDAKIKCGNCGADIEVQEYGVEEAISCPCGLLASVIVPNPLEFPVGDIEEDDYLRRRYIVARGALLRAQKFYNETCDLIREANK